MTSEALLLVTTTNPRLEPSNTRTSKSQSPTFLPCQLLAHAPFPHPMFSRNYPNVYLSTPTPFHAYTFPHPYLSTPIPFHTRIFQHPYSPALSTIQAFILSPRQPPRPTRCRSCSATSLPPTYAPTSSSGPIMADLKAKITAVHDGQGRMAIYVDESVGQEAIVSHFAPRYQ